MRRVIATVLAVGVTVLTPALVMAAGDKAAAEQGRADRAAAEKAAAKAAEKTDKAVDKLEKAAHGDGNLDKASDGPTDKATDKGTEKSNSDQAAAPSAAPAASDKPSDAAPKPADPLNLRPTHAIEAVPATSSMGLGTKIALAALIGGAAFVVYKRRRGTAPAKPAQLRVTARASIGARTEVCIVEVDGQRLLLGVTPSSIRTLTVLTQEEIVETAATPAEESLARLFASAKRDLDDEPEDIEEPFRRPAPPASRPVLSARAARSTPLPDSGRPTVLSPPSRAEKAEREAPTPTKKIGARRSTPNVEGQVSGLLTMRSGRS